MNGSYPPPHHVLRDLDFEVEVVADDVHRAAFRPGSGTRVELGAVLTVVDLLAGSLCIDVVAPDWMATSGLSFHLTRPLPPGELALEGRILRAGRTTVTIEVDAADPVSGQPLGEGIVTFARIRRPGAPSIAEARSAPGGRFSFHTPGATAVGTDGSMRDAIGCRVVDPSAGATMTPVDGYLLNSFGAVNGGVVATVVEAAALALSGAADGDPPDAVRAEVGDLSLHYLAQGRDGPLRTTATLLRSGWGERPGPVTMRVEVFDGQGHGTSRMAVAHVSTSRRT